MSKKAVLVDITRYHEAEIGKGEEEPIIQFLKMLCIKPEELDTNHPLFDYYDGKQVFELTIRLLKKDKAA